MTNIFSKQNTKVQTNFSSTFISKVMVFVGLAMLVSAAGTYTMLIHGMKYIIATPALAYALYAVELVLVFTARFWSQRSPLNKMLFFLFSFVSGLTIAPLIVMAVNQGGMVLVVKALVATGLMFGATALIGATTQINLSGMRGFLVTGLIGMIITGVIGIFVPYSNTFEMFFSGFGVILFSVFIAYDIQRIKNYPENMYIEAALNLYLDIFNLFISILRLLMAFGRD